MSRLPIDLMNQIISSEENKIKIFCRYMGVPSRILAEKAQISEEELKKFENTKLDVLCLPLLKIAQTLGVDEELFQDAYCLLSNIDLQLLDFIFYKQEKNYNLSLLKKQILNWASLVLYYERKNWEENKKNTAEILYSLRKKNDAVNRAKCRDKKYAPFREYFRIQQQKKYLEYQKTGQKLSANSFAAWFIEHKDEHLEIPYAKQNQKNKLTQLAQANNREFNKSFQNSDS